MKNPILCVAGLLLLTSCTKTVDALRSKSATSITNNPATSVATTYMIPQGQHECGQRSLKFINTSELKFTVQFDSTAIYKTLSAENQYDINKLYGFSDNNASHHLYSARFGWRWSDGALRLFAYTYNKGIMASEELGTIAIGQEARCSIKVTATTYIFTLNDSVKTLPRLSTTATAQGYLLYPYFGGDETAPHYITISIKDLP